jgi:hypothetical protein
MAAVMAAQVVRLLDTTLANPSSGTDPQCRLRFTFGYCTWSSNSCPEQIKVLAPAGGYCRQPWSLLLSLSLCTIVLAARLRFGVREACIKVHT